MKYHNTLLHPRSYAVIEKPLNTRYMRGHPHAQKHPGEIRLQLQRRGIGTLKYQ